MTGPGRRRTGRLGGLALAAALLAGCAGVPTSGPVRQGPPITVDDQDLIYRAIPQPPQPGMSPDEVVRGFLAASSSGSDGYGVARQFLAPAAAQAWQPLANVSIYDSSGVQTKVSGTEVTVTGVLDGTVGRDGAYQVATGGQRLQVRYRMTTVAGEWRIASLPDGLVLGRGDIDREFRTYNLYFFDPTYSVLVPDPVTVPVVGSALATTLVRALLRGPTQWLAPAVRTAFPEGTALELDSVTVDNGTASVALSTQVLAADDSTRAALSAQLVWTLRALPAVTGVRITAGGQPLSVPGAGPVQDVDMWSARSADAAIGADPRLYAVDRTGLVRLTDDGDLAPSAGGFGTGDPMVSTPAVSPDGAQIAAVSARDRRELWVQSASSAAAPHRVLADAVDLSRPSWDRTGALWVVDRGGRGVVMIANDAPVAVPVVDLPRGVSSGAVVGIAIAPDATRAALLLRRAGRVEPWLARIERDGGSVRLAAPRRVESAVVEGFDLGWKDVEHLSVLGVDGAGATKLFEVSPGLHTLPTSTVPADATQLAVAPTAQTVVGGGGRLYRQTTGMWTIVGRGGDPAYPG